MDASLLKGIVSPILGAAVFLAAVSTVAVAIVEFVKALTRARLFFHRWSVRKWTAGLDRSVSRLLPDLGRWTVTEARPSVVVSEQSVLGELLLLAAGGHDYDKALYDQPTEKMMAQIQAAANVALEFLNEYPCFYGFLTTSDVRDKKLSAAARATIVPVSGAAVSGGASEAAKAAVASETASDASAEYTGAPSDPVKWRAGMDAMRYSHSTRGVERKIAVNSEEVAAADSMRKAAEDTGKARSRLNNLVARKLDTFQNETRYMWDRLNQMIASALCGGIIWLALRQISISAEKISGFPTGGLAMILYAVFGGIAAPFAKDVVTGLASFAKKA